MLLERIGCTLKQLLSLLRQELYWSSRLKYGLHQKQPTEHTLTTAPTTTPNPITWITIDSILSINKGFHKFMAVKIVYNMIKNCQILRKVGSQLNLHPDSGSSMIDQPEGAKLYTLDRILKINALKLLQTSL